MGTLADIATAQRLVIVGYILWADVRRWQNPGADGAPKPAAPGQEQFKLEVVGY
ncbi:MAG: hypothetical protein PVH11_00215 [Anaerolineae bacterium]